MGEDVADLADGDDLAAMRDHPVEQGRLGRRHGKILAVRRAAEGLAGLADERPGDHAADMQRVAQVPHHLAEIIEALEPEMLLMRGDLQNGVDGSVADRHAGPDMLLAEILDHRGSRRVAIGEDARHPALPDHRFRQFGRKGGDGVGEIPPVEAGRQAGDLPMAGRRVLAAGHFLRGAVEARLQPSAGVAVEGKSAAQPGGVRQAQRRHCGKTQRSLAQAFAVAAAVGAGLRDMSERIRAVIAVACGVCCAADAEGVENEDESARHAGSCP